LSIVKIRFWQPGRFLSRGFRGGLEKMLSATRDRGFESISLQQRVRCEPDFLGRGWSWMLWSPRPRRCAITC